MIGLLSELDELAAGKQPARKSRHEITDFIVHAQWDEDDQLVRASINRNQRGSGIRTEIFTAAEDLARIAAIIQGAT